MAFADIHAFEFIQLRDFDTTPERYVAYLRDTHAAAKNTLAKPAEQWPRGSSHEVSRAIIHECDMAYEDVVLEFGLFSAEGKLVGFAER